MSAHNPPVRQFVPDWSEEVPPFQPIGHDAPRHSLEWANYTAACIASREVAGRARFSDAHRQSLHAWMRGERAWPWPDPTPEEKAGADEAVAELVAPVTRRQREDRRKVQERIARDRRMAVRRNCQEWSK